MKKKTSPPKKEAKKKAAKKPTPFKGKPGKKKKPDDYPLQDYLDKLDDIEGDNKLEDDGTLDYPIPGNMDGW